MKLFEIAIEYHDQLNPKLWNEDMELEDQVHVKLLEIANEFIDYLDVPIDVEDIIITGSNANYNWTSESDIDLHIVIDLDAFRDECPDLTDDFFMSKKTLWNEHHDIEIYGHDVELYVQDDDEVHIATGVYSVLNDKWIKVPDYIPPTYDSEDVKAKADEFKALIDKVISGDGSSEEVKRVKEKIRKMRRAGLRQAGEYSTENLAFKELRNSGYLEKLSDYSKEIYSDELSLS